MQKLRVRMLLRVSSDQQLEADGDLSIQRQIILDYVKKHDNWTLDEKEYFEGSKSAYKNTAGERETLQDVLKDAEKKEFDILVLYKDDRVGRLMWDTPLYIMNLKKYGVDVYTVKDGLISPESDDIMGQMMLTFRYANAQKSSADTGMRVKDTAVELVRNGKFMGGRAPYGYRLEYSGEVSKHGRALKHLVVVPEQMDVVKYIYELSLNKEYGSAKIAKVLNTDERFSALAPNDVWKSGTITSILKNPIYAGRTAYKRREHINGEYHRLDSEDWVVSKTINEQIVSISEESWNRTQERRKLRGEKYKKSLANQDVTVIARNDGTLALIDVIHCGYCGRKMTNGSRYNYWTVKATGERRTSKIPIYKCQNACSGMIHEKTHQFRADKIESIIFDSLAAYIGRLQENESIFEEIERNHQMEQREREKAVKREQAELEKIEKNIAVMEGNIPNAMTGTYPLSLDELVALIKKQKEAYQVQMAVVREKEQELNTSSVTRDEWLSLRKEIPSWQKVFLESDAVTKRVLVNRLISRIDVTKEQVVVKFKVNLEDFLTQPRMNEGLGVPESGI